VILIMIRVDSIANVPIVLTNQRGSSSVILRPQNECAFSVYSDRGSTFAFPSEEQHSNNGHRRSPPPELGIEESPADWEFGDRSARVKVCVLRCEHIL
jgi:hypothetical protein